MKVLICGRNLLTAWDLRLWDFTLRRMIVGYWLFWGRHFWSAWPLNIGPIGFTETSVRRYHYTLRKIPEERRSHLDCDGSLWLFATCAPLLLADNRSSGLVAQEQFYTARYWSVCIYVLQVNFYIKKRSSGLIPNSGCTIKYLEDSFPE
jgi:hypothetical protein